MGPVAESAPKNLEAGVVEHSDAAGPTPSIGDFERVVLTLVEGAQPHLGVRGLSQDRATFIFSRATTKVEIEVVKAGAPDELPQRLAEVMSAPRSHALDVILVGGGHELKDLFRGAVPTLTPVRVGLLHLPSDGSEPWASSRMNHAHQLLVPLAEKSRGIRSDPQAWQDLLTATASARQAVAARNAEVLAFNEAMSAHRPWATWSIATVLLGLFGVATWLGGSEEAPVLVRMGALLPDRVFAGEWWRLVSCTFLHAGVWHVALNVYVLVLLGSFLEKIIGAVRFLVLYGLSAVGGSVASCFLLQAEMSVGASGAVWGLLGAHGALAFRPQGLLPQAFLPQLRKAAGFNLVINLLNSFRPRIDLWAHLGGGLVGALLFASGLFTKNVSALGPRPSPAPPGFKFAALVVGGLLLGGLTAAGVSGRPLELIQPPSTHEVQLAELGIAIQRPPGRDTLRSKREQGLELAYGNPLADPATVNLYAVPIPALDPQAVEDELGAIRQTLDPPEHATPHEPIATFEREGRPVGVTASYAYPNGLLHEQAFIFLDGRLLRVDVLRWSAFPVAAPAGFARHLAETARVLPQPLPELRE